MVMQAFIDESFDDEVFVLGGYIAKEETWVSFVSEWNSILPFASLNANNDRRFKMSEMAKSPDRMEKAVAFFRVIEKFKSDIIGVSVSFRCKDHNEALRRIYRRDGTADYCGCDSHYILAVSVLFNLIYMREQGDTISQFIGSESVDFIFDERQKESKAILEAWDAQVTTLSPEERKCFGDTPKFGREECFLPLQAADMRCWMVREAFKTQTDRLERNGVGFGFAEIKGEARMPSIRYDLDEDGITNGIIKAIKVTYPDAIVFDDKFS
jgi:hypothetical protein